MARSLSKQTEFAWCAGFFDGEGCTRVNEVTSGNGYSRYRILTIQITQKDRRALDRFQAAMGMGKIYLRADGSHVYCLNRDADVHQALEAMWPYLGEVKRLQANSAIERAIGKVA